MKRKRLEYKNVIFLSDEKLNNEIQRLARELVNKVIYDVGKEYEIMDLEGLLMGWMRTEFEDVALEYAYEEMMKSKKEEVP